MVLVLPVLILLCFFFWLPSFFGISPHIFYSLQDHLVRLSVCRLDWRKGIKGGCWRKCVSSEFSDIGEQGTNMRFCFAFLVNI